MRTLTVRASKKYKIYVTRDLSRFKECVLPIVTGERVALIADSEALRLHGKSVKTLFSDKKLFVYVIEQGESSKNLVNYGKLLNALANDGFTRNDCVVAFGGGMVGDLAAFVASTYMRGIKLIAVPTTLLSMVDSSVGGKTAVNLEKGKNLCGSFYQPNAVYINLGFLSTLPEREKESGMGEVVKYSYLSKRDNIGLDGVITEKLIYDCLKIKAEIVSADERENGMRKLLNFGHTVGHAIERLSDFRLSHGLCVAKGMKYAIALSGVYFGLEKANIEKLNDRLGYFSDLSCEYSAEQLQKVILSDKKSDGESVSFVLINKDGNAETVKIPVDGITDFIKKGERFL